MICRAIKLFFFHVFGNNYKIKYLKALRTHDQDTDVNNIYLKILIVKFLVANTVELQKS